MNPIRMPFPAQIPAPPKDVFLDFEQEEISFFIPKELCQAMQEELKSIRAGVPQQKVEKESYWREYFATIPQPEKPGPNGVTPIYTSGVVLTEDLMVGYFDRDILHIILLWSKGEGNDKGWVLPGKRDRAYDSSHGDISIQDKLVPNGDISIQDANETLVQKEIGVARTDIGYHFVLGYFDDRKREGRFKSSGVVSLVLLNKRPTLEPGQKIGIPLNGLKLMAERRMRIPREMGSQEVYGLARNHDSLLLQLFNTAKFYHTMQKIKIAQGQWTRLLEDNPLALRPPLPSVEPNQECAVCMNLFVGSLISCEQGHTICGICLPILQRDRKKECYCRKPLLERPIRNLALDELIQSLNPEKYEARFQELTGHAPVSWLDDAKFCGDAITYRA